MIYSFLNNIFEDIDQSAIDLMDKIWVNSKGRHFLFIGSNENLSKIKSSEWYKNLRRLSQQQIDLQFVSSFQVSKDKSKLLISDRSKLPDEYSLPEAEVILCQPVLIVLENGLNDRYFLETIFKYFDTEHRNSESKLITFIKSRWIQFQNAGGWTNIKNHIKGELRNYDHLPAAYTNEQHKYLKCFVLIDNDKKHPTQNIEQDKEKLQKWLDEKNIKVHILKKRAMENYMPDDVIQRIPTLKLRFKDLKYWVRAYNKLSDEQKDFLDYKRGFSKKNQNGNPIIARTDLEPEVQKLYLSLSPSEYDVLDKGLEFPKFKDSFPALFEEPKIAYAVHKTSLLNREGGTTTGNEFLDIIKKINDLL